MKFFNFFFLILIILYSTLTIAQSKDKLAYINLDDVIEKSTYGKKILIEIKLLKKENIKKLKNIENDIKSNENELNKKKYFVSKNLKKSLKNLSKNYLNLEKLKIK